MTCRFSALAESSEVQDCQSKIAESKDSTPGEKLCSHKLNGDDL